MRIIKFIIVLFFALFFMILFVSFKEVNVKNFTIDYQNVPFNIENISTIQTIKMIKRNQNIELVFSTKHKMNPRKIFSIPTRGGMSQLLTQLPPFPMLRQEWDFTVSSDSCFSTVFTDGINFNSILTQNYHSDGNILTSKNNIIVTKEYMYRNFFHPRFIKRYNDSLVPISAIFENEGNHRRVGVVFFKMKNSAYDEFKELTECDDCIIITYKNGFLLFYKKNVPGHPRGEMDIYPGSLSCVKLDKNFNMIGESTQLFENRYVYEFDVDIIKDKIVTYLTTKKGVILTMLNSFAEPFKIKLLHIEEHEEVLSQPTILADDSRIYLSVVESLATNNARILTGSLSIDKLP